MLSFIVILALTFVAIVTIMIVGCIAWASLGLVLDLRESR